MRDCDQIRAKDSAPTKELLQGIRIALDGMLPQAINVVLPIDGKGELHPEEQACIAHASESRQQEYKAGRIAARQALAQLGVHDFALLKGEQGEPLWPAGVAGSISHSEGVCIVSVASKEQCFSLGIDIQKQRPLKANIERVICRDEELSLDWHADKNTALLILFTVKEAGYKALHPQVKKHIGFKEVAMTVKPENTYSLVYESSVVNGKYSILDSFVIAVGQL